jgi:hypothetical protein
MEEYDFSLIISIALECCPAIVLSCKSDFKCVRFVYMPSS